MVKNLKLALLTATTLAMTPAFGADAEGGAPVAPSLTDVRAAIAVKKDDRNDAQKAAVKYAADESGKIVFGEGLKIAAVDKLLATFPQMMVRRGLMTATEASPQDQEEIKNIASQSMRVVRTIADAQAPLLTATDALLAELQKRKLTEDADLSTPAGVIAEATRLMKPKTTTSDLLAKIRKHEAIAESEAKTEAAAMTDVRKRAGQVVGQLGDAQKALRAGLIQDDEDLDTEIATARENVALALAKTKYTDPTRDQQKYPNNRKGNQDWAAFAKAHWQGYLRNLETYITEHATAVARLEKLESAKKAIEAMEDLKDPINDIPPATTD